MNEFKFCFKHQTLSYVVIFRAVIPWVLKSQLRFIHTNDIHTNLDPVVISCCPSSPGDLTSKAKLLPSTI